MGIHAIDNLSHLAYDDTEPYVPNHYDYDEYVIMELHGRTNTENDSWTVVEKRTTWSDARRVFLHLFNNERRAVRLVGRVFN